MANHAVGQGAAGLSVILGILVLAGSSLFLHDWRRPYEDCKEAADFIGVGTGDLCKPVEYFVIGAAVAVVAALIQIVTSALGFLKKGKAWALIQILVLLLMIIGFALPVSERAYDIEDAEVEDYDHRVYRWRAFAYMGVTAVNAIVTLLMIPVTFIAS